MTASSGTSASSRTIGGVISDLENSGLRIDDVMLMRVVDSIITDYIRTEYNARNIAFGPVGGVGRVVFAEPIIMYGDEAANPWIAEKDVPSQLVFKAVTGGSCQMADRESIIQTVIAEKTEGRTCDGTPVVPRVLESNDITFGEYYLDVLCALKGAPLRAMPENANYDTRLSLEPDLEQHIRELVSVGEDKKVVRIGDQNVCIGDISRLRNARIPLISMEQLRGITLIEYLRLVDPVIQQSALTLMRDGKIERIMPAPENPDESFPLSHRLKLVKAISDAFDLFHETGYVHRDAKPANIFLTHTGGGEYAAKIVDCGTVLSEGDELDRGLFVGTMKYASPEQYEAVCRNFCHADGRSKNPEAQNEPVTATKQLDIFSLGVMFYSILKRKQLYENSGNGGRARTLLDAYARIQSEDSYLGELGAAVNSNDQEYLNSPEGMIDNILYKCLRRDPNDRYESCRELSADISKALKRLDDAKLHDNHSSGLYEVKLGERVRAGAQEDIFLYENGAIEADDDIGSVNIEFDPAEFEAPFVQHRNVA